MREKMKLARWIGLGSFVLLIAFWVAPWRALLAQATHDIVIAWTYTQGADVATGFNVYRATSTGGPYTKINAAPLPVTTLTYKDSTGAGGTKYFYVIRAVDAIGIESVNSSETSATMLGAPNPPTAPQAVAE